MRARQAGPAWPVATRASLPGRSAAARSTRTSAPARVACPRSRAAEPSLSSAHVSPASSLGQLGGLVTRKRDVLTGAAPTAPADFTVGAPAKDMALLADASGAPLRSAAGLTDAPAGDRLDPAADIGVATTTEPAADHVEGLRDGRFVSWSLDATAPSSAAAPPPTSRPGAGGSTPSTSTAASRLRP